MKKIDLMNQTEENKAQLSGFFEVYKFFRPLCKTLDPASPIFLIVFSEDAPLLEDRLSIVLSNLENMLMLSKR